MIKIYRIGFKETHEEGYHYIGRKRSVSILTRELKMYEPYKEYVLILSLSQFLFEI